MGTQVGNSGNDTLIGGDGPDTLDGQGGDDILQGMGGNDTLHGRAGNDALDGGAGSDDMFGGSGNDVYQVDHVGDRVTEASAADGLDLVQSSVSFTLGVYLENLTLTGAAAANGIGNGLDNILNGNSGANLLKGHAGDDDLSGGEGNDTLNGGTGADSMFGGGGNDTYYVDAATDTVSEDSATGGRDTVIASVTFRLGRYVENLTLTGSAAIDGTGNSLSNTLVGNAAANTLEGRGGNDTLNGGGGSDTLVGGAGNDTYVVDRSGDVVTEAAAQGTDLVQSKISYTLGAHVENLTLTGAAIAGTGNALANVLLGNSQANTLIGLGGNDTLDGGAGADRMEGGNGDDTYIVGAAGDQAIEKASAGLDHVQSRVSYTLGANVENLTLAGTGGIDGSGNNLANTIVGNAAANVLRGGAGNDTLMGGLGRDMASYADASAGVQINLNTATQAASGGVGADTLTSIEGVIGSNFNDVITGNNADNKLRGELGNDTLAGGAGDDSLGGGIGNDTLYGDKGVDTLWGGEGDDVLDGGTYDDTLNGGEGNDTLHGGDGRGNDTLSGGDGNDDLNGGEASDSLTGGAGADSFRFDSYIAIDSDSERPINSDHITDFSVADDTIILDNDIFAAAGAAGTLSESAFYIGAAAHDADDRIIYNSATGEIYYDADGIGGGDQVRFATVTAGTALTTADFLIVADATSSVATSVQKGVASGEDQSDLLGTELESTMSHGDLADLGAHLMEQEQWSEMQQIHRLDWNSVDYFSS